MITSFLFFVGYMLRYCVRSKLEGNRATALALKHDIHAHQVSTIEHILVPSIRRWFKQYGDERGCVLHLALTWYICSDR